MEIAARELGAVVKSVSETTNLGHRNKSLCGHDIKSEECNGVH